MDLPDWSGLLTYVSSLLIDEKWTWGLITGFFGRCPKNDAAQSLKQLGA